MSTGIFALIVQAMFVGLALAAFMPSAGRAPVAWRRVILGYLVGVGVGLMCYLLPRGVDSINGREDFQPRFFVALAITFAIGVLIARIGQTPSRYAPVALFAYLGVLTPPIVVFLSIVIRCAGAAPCLS